MTLQVLAHVLYTAWHCLREIQQFFGELLVVAPPKSWTLQLLLQVDPPCQQLLVRRSSVRSTRPAIPSASCFHLWKPRLVLALELNYTTRYRANREVTFLVFHIIYFHLEGLIFFLQVLSCPSPGSWHPFSGARFVEYFLISTSAIDCGPPDTCLFYPEVGILSPQAAY